jgi:predicted small metal-binding protein
MPNGRSEEAFMDRKFIDCRDYPSESGCSIAISADSEDEVVEAAAQHAVKVHGHEDGPDLRAMLRQGVKSGMPAA